MTGDADDFESGIKRFLNRIEGSDHTLVDCQQVTAGASQQTFKLTVKQADGQNICYALRREQPGQINRSSGQLAATTEAYLLTRAKDSGVCVPDIRAELEPSDGLGSGYLMSWVEGETLGQRIVRRPEFEAVRQTLAFACGRELATIHAISIDDGLAKELQQTTPERLVRDTWAAYQALETPQPMIDFTAQWLLANIPAAVTPRLVHGDFRNGNLMIDKSGLVAVLDWELAHIGDPMRDLGWLCVNSWRFGQSALPVGGFGAVDDLIAGYESVSEQTVDKTSIKFWQVFGSFWWSVTTLGMAATWRSGETPSLERPVIGRRSSEAQLDCVNLIIPGDASLTDGALISTSADLPETMELIASVRSYLSDTVAKNSEGADKFIARVAANSLTIAEREFSMGLAFRLKELARLSALMGEGDLPSLRRRLCEEFRAGRCLDDPLIAQHLRQTAVDRCWVDQPTYSALNAYRPAGANQG